MWHGMTWRGRVSGDGSRGEAAVAVAAAAAAVAEGEKRERDHPMNHLNVCTASLCAAESLLLLLCSTLLTASSSLFSRLFALSFCLSSRRSLLARPTNGRTSLLLPKCTVQPVFSLLDLGMWGMKYHRRQ